MSWLSDLFTGRRRQPQIQQKPQPRPQQPQLRVNVAGLQRALTPAQQQPRPQLRVTTAPQQNLNVGRRVVAPTPNKRALGFDREQEIQKLLHPNLVNQVKTNLGVKLALARAAGSEAAGLGRDFVTRPAVQAATSLVPKQITVRPTNPVTRALIGNKPVQNIERGVVSTYQNHPNLPAPARIGLAGLYGAGQIAQDIPVAAPVLRGAVKAAPKAAKAAKAIDEAAFTPRLVQNDVRTLIDHSNYLAGAGKVGTPSAVSKNMVKAREIAKRNGIDISQGTRAQQLENVNRLLDNVSQRNRAVAQGGYVGGNTPKKPNMRMFEYNDTPLTDAEKRVLAQLGDNQTNTDYSSAANELRKLSNESGQPELYKKVMGAISTQNMSQAEATDFIKRGLAQMRNTGTNAKIRMGVKEPAPEAGLQRLNPNAKVNGKDVTAGYVYHGTAPGALEGIIKSGMLEPRTIPKVEAGNKPWLFVDPSEKEAAAYASTRGGNLLRFKSDGRKLELDPEDDFSLSIRNGKDVLPSTVREMPSLKTTEGVHARDLEVKVGNKWVPLESLAEKNRPKTKGSVQTADQTGVITDPLSVIKQEALKYGSADEFHNAIQRASETAPGHWNKDRTAWQVGFPKNKLNASEQKLRALTVSHDPKVVPPATQAFRDFASSNGHTDPKAAITDFYNQAHAEVTPNLRPNAEANVFAQNPMLAPRSTRLQQPNQTIQPLQRTNGFVADAVFSGKQAGKRVSTVEQKQMTPSLAENTPTAIKVKGSMSDADYFQRYGKERTGTNLKVKPFTAPKLNLNSWSDKSALGLGRETLERNLDRIAGNDAPAVKKFLVDSSRNNETARTNFANTLRRDTKKNIVKDLGIKPNSKESELTQKFGEKLINEQDLVNEVGAEKAAKIIQASDYFRKQYDTLIDVWNKKRAQYGYDPIPKRDDYFRHFQAINNAGSILGTIKNARDLPTEISGITDIFSPSQPFSDAALHRQGNKTTFDAVRGFDNYIDSISRQIFHTDTVQKGRAIESSIRKAAKDDPTIDLPNFVANLHEWTNVVSGKKTRIDRAAEELVGRKVYAVAQAVKNKTGANMIGANLGSALTNFIPFTQAASTTSKPALLKAIKDTAVAPFSKDFRSIDGQVSSFLTRRFPEKSIGMSKLEKASNVASSPFFAVDSFTARSIVAGKYYENVSKGMKPAEAMRAADDYASRVITDRSVGQLPNLLETKTSGFITQFQAEVNNQVSFLLRDIPALANGNKAKIASSLTQFVLYSYLANEAYQHLLGRRVQLDPAHAVATVANPNSMGSERLDALKQDVLGGLPFTSVATGGRLPVNAMAPDVASIAKGVGDLGKDKNQAARELYKGVSGPLFYGIPPFGGGQVKKTVEDLQNQSKGYSETPAGTKRFDMPTNGIDATRGAVFGQYSTTPGQQYIKNLKAGKNATNGGAVSSGKVVSDNKSLTPDQAVKAAFSTSKEGKAYLAMKAADRKAAAATDPQIRAMYETEKAVRQAYSTPQLHSEGISDESAKVLDRYNRLTTAGKKKFEENFSDTYKLKVAQYEDKVKSGTATPDETYKAERGLLPYALAQANGAKTSADFKKYSESPLGQFQTMDQQYQLDKKNSKLSPIEDYQMQAKLYKAQVQSQFSKDAVDIMGMSEKKIGEFLKGGSVSKELYAELQALDQASIAAGLYKYSKLDGGSGSGGGSGGKKKSTLAVPGRITLNIKRPTIGVSAPKARQYAFNNIKGAAPRTSKIKATLV